MILEVAPLHIRAGETAAFEAAFSRAQVIIASMPGYISHELRRCLERTNEYICWCAGKRWKTMKSASGNPPDISSGNNCCTIFMSRFLSCRTMRR